MGLNESRNANLPEDIDANQAQYERSWVSEIISEIGVNKSKYGQSTLSPQTLEIAGDFLAKYLEKNILSHNLNVKILEPFAGNGVGSRIIYNELTKKIPFVVLKSTDLQDLSEYTNHNSHPVEFGINAVETIRKYDGDKFNILMMISPPPSQAPPKVKTIQPPSPLVIPLECQDYFSGYGDYFAIREWEKSLNSELLVFIGELGASDGSEGLYKYLLKNNPIWELVFRTIIYSGTDFFGGAIEKEIFIFKKVKKNKA